MAEEESTQGRSRKRRTAPRSAVWEHFTRFIAADGKDKARCKRCHLVLGAATKSGTSSLWGHVKICNQRDGVRRELHQTQAAAPPPPPSLPLPYAPSRSAESLNGETGFEEEVAGVAAAAAGGDLAPMIALNGYDPSVVEDGHFSLWGHVKICNELHQTQAPPPPPPPPPPCAPSRSAESLKGETGFEGEEVAAATGAAGGDLARMIALNGYDRSFVRRLNPAFKLPSRQAIEEMCDDIFDRTRKDLFSRLRHTSGRISLAVGKTEAIEWDEIFYTSCHFIDNDWNLHRVVMDAYDHIPFPLFHGPLSGVPEVAPGCHDICLLAIDRVMDGGEGDIPVLDALDRVFMVARDKRDKHILTQPNDYIKEKYPSTHPGRRREVICDTYMDIVLHMIGLDLILHRDLVIDLLCVHAIESGVQDLRLTRQRRQHLLSYLGLDNPRADKYRWYSCYCSLEVLRSEGSCIIPGIDMELIQLLCNVWRTIYCAIKRISVSSTPTSNICLAELFSLREVLQTEIARAGGHNADVLRKARDNLDKSLEDSYLVWSIPLILDPRYKLKYVEFSFRRAFSPERAAYYISEVTRNIRKVYSDYVQYDGGTSGTYSDVSKVMTDGRAGTLEQAWDEHCRTQASMTPEVAISYPEARTELDRYLTDCLAPRIERFDILNWWKVHSLQYPTMARIARDALAMPTCSQLSAEQIAHVRSIIRGYSKEYYKHQVGLV